VLFNFFAAVEASADVCIAHGTLCNDPSVCIATTAKNCGCEFRPRQIRSVSAEPLGEIQHAGAPDTAAKSVIPCLLSVSDYKRAHTSLYFIITHFHTELKTQIKVNHGMN